MEQVLTVADLGDVVRTARHVRGWSQQRAADAAGVSRRFVNMVEGGQHANAEVGRVLALLDALEVRLGALVPGTQPDTQTEARSTLADRPADSSGDDDVDLDAYLATFYDPHEGAAP